MYSNTDYNFFVEKRHQFKGKKPSNHKTNLLSTMESTRLKQSTRFSYPVNTHNTDSKNCDFFNRKNNGFFPSCRLVDSLFFL